MDVTSYLKGTIYTIIEKKYGIWLFKVKMLYNKPFGMSNNFLVHIKKKIVQNGKIHLNNKMYNYTNDVIQ